MAPGAPPAAAFVAAALARMPALAPASSSDSESDGDAPELASASSSDDEAEVAPPQRAAAGPRVVRVGRHDDVEEPELEEGVATVVESRLVHLRRARTRV